MPFSALTKSYVLEERLYATLRIPYTLASQTQRTLYVFQSVIVDTGALFSIFPFDFYQDFQQHVELLEPGDLISNDATFDPVPLFTVKGVGAPATSCQFGRVTVHFSDATCYTPSVDILAHFLPQGATWTQPVLGLGGNAIGGQRFEINTSPDEAWLHVQ